MSTVNISLPTEQVSLVDQMISHHGFANRSEFFRSMLRLLRNHPELIDQASTYPFVSPATKSSAKVIADFKKTNKYSQEFLDDLTEGLKNSTYFTK